MDLFKVPIFHSDHSVRSKAAGIHSCNLTHKGNHWITHHILTKGDGRDRSETKGEKHTINTVKEALHTDKGHAYTGSNEAERIHEAHNKVLEPGHQIRYSTGDLLYFIIDSLHNTGRLIDSCYNGIYYTWGMFTDCFSSTESHCLSEILSIEGRKWHYGRHTTICRPILLNLLIIGELCYNPCYCTKNRCDHCQRKRRSTCCLLHLRWQRCLCGRGVDFL